jgi:outer membrane receptor protein involved in Fe transport
VYRTASSDDIIFVSSGIHRGQGYFANVDRTERTGLETTVQVAASARLSAFATYTLQRAVFGTDLRIASPLHPDADGGAIDVQSGDRLPGVPMHSAKFGAMWSDASGPASGGPWIRRLAVGFDVVTQTGTFVRGDEANLLSEVPGFVVTNVHGRFRFAPRVSAIAQVSNLFNRRFSTFGTLGDASILGPGAGVRFESPGEPRGAWAGIEVGF